MEEHASASCLWEGLGLGIMIPTAYVDHQLPRRIRLRVPERRGDSRYFDSVREALAQHSAVERLIVTPLTASILVHHNGAVEPIAARASERGLFEIARARQAASPSASRANGSAPLPGALNAVANGLAGLALLQTNRDFGTAIDNFWNAYGATRLQRPGLAALFVAVGAYQGFSGRYLGSATSLFLYSLVTRELAATGAKAAPRAAAQKTKTRDRQKRMTDLSNR